MLKEEELELEYEKKMYHEKLELLQKEISSQNDDNKINYALTQPDCVSPSSSILKLDKRFSQINP